MGLNMIDWKAFADEVPTEPRTVLCGLWDYGMVDLKPYAYVDGEWVANDEVHGHNDGETWCLIALRHAFTHWVYIDPPNVTP